MINIKKHLDLLGMKVEDRITGFSGVVVSVAFDLYGCIQAIVNPGSDKDGKLMDSQWFDVNRLKIKETNPVMDKPEFDWSPEKISKGNKGPSEKPKFCKP